MKIIIITCFLFLAALGEAPMSAAKNATTAGVSASPLRHSRARNATCFNEVSGRKQKYTYWKRARIVGLSSIVKPETTKTSSFKKCAAACCSSRLCSVIAWKKSSKTCYNYGLVFIDEKNRKRAKGWTAGKV